MTQDNKDKNREHLIKYRHNIAAVINKIMLTLLTVSSLCWLTSGSPDRLLLIGEPSVKLPFTESLVSLAGFLGLAAAALLVITTYLHVFLGSFLRLTNSLGEDAEPLPILFCLDSRIAKLLGHAIFYWITPLTLFALAYKAFGIPMQGWPLTIISVIVAVSMSAIYWQRYLTKKKSKFIIIAFFHHAITLLIALTTLFAMTQFSFSRPLNLDGADLSNEWLANTKLRHSRLVRANLENTYLGGADLSKADLTAANLSGTNLTEAILISATMMGVKATGANLRGADMTGTLTVGADFSDANLKSAIMTNINTYTVIMSGRELNAALFHIPRGRWFTDFTGANLSNANLTNASLVYARLQQADLRNADLSGADLSGADLSGARLDGALLFNVIYCRTTMPDGQVEQPNCHPRT